MAKFCSECGSKIGDNAKFCENCGTPCEPAVNASQPQPIPQPVQPPQQSQPWNQPQQPPQWQPPQQAYQPIQQAAPQRYYAVPGNTGAHPYPYAAPDAPGASDKKSHLGLGIGVVVGLVLLIAAVVVVLVVIRPFGSSSGNGSPEALLKQMDEKYYNTDDPDIDQMMSMFYHYHFLMNDDEKQSEHDGIARSHKEMRAYYLEQYGDDMTVSSKITDSRTLSEDEMKSLYFYTGASYDEPIPVVADEIREIHAEQTITGSKRTQTVKLTFECIKRDGEWYIGDNIRYETSEEASAQSERSVR